MGSHALPAEESVYVRGGRSRLREDNHGVIPSKRPRNYSLVLSILEQRSVALPCIYTTS